MTAPPLPASPVMRVRLDYTQSDGAKGGSRFYLGYAGASPTPGNCATLASDIASAWSSELASSANEGWALTEIDVLDIASISGASGQWAGNEPGTVAGADMPAQTAINVEFGIARRYRGGKPRMFLPPNVQANTADASHWSASLVTGVNTAMAAFFSNIEALSIGAVGALTHVNVSYYSGFTNITNSSGRTRAVPTYRHTALVDTVESYITKAEFGSQRRRRVATTY